MEMHAIQSKQASMSSGCIVGKPEVRAEQRVVQEG